MLKQSVSVVIPMINEDKSIEKVIDTVISSLENSSLVQEKEIDRLGGKSPIKVDTRIIATSNRDLEKCTLDGTFRQDLYYRLNVININIPDLKDRVGDIIVHAKDIVGFVNGYPVSIT